MIINASSIGMSSERAYNSYSSSRVLGITMKADVAATLELSEEGKSYLLQLEEQLKEREKEQITNCSPYIACSFQEPSASIFSPA